MTGFLGLLLMVAAALLAGALMTRWMYRALQRSSKYAEEHRGEDMILALLAGFAGMLVWPITLIVFGITKAVSVACDIYGVDPMELTDRVLKGKS